MLQAAGRSGDAEPTGHAVRMDALHLVRAAAEFADALEKDAQDAAVRVIRRAESEIADKQREFQKERQQIERHGREAEQKRTELLAEAEKAARETRDKADREAKQQLKEAEARGSTAARAGAPPGDRADEHVLARRSTSQLEWARVAGRRTSSAGRAKAPSSSSERRASADTALDRVVTSIVGESEASPKPSVVRHARRRPGVRSAAPTTSSSDSTSRIAPR